MWPFSKSDEEIIASVKPQFMLDCVKIPSNINDLPRLSALVSKFSAPETVDLRDYCTRTENQGSNPWCAAYTAAGFAENILWRKNDYPTDIDAADIYQRAKLIDGDPNGAGTTLDAVLQVLLNKGIFDPKTCSIRIIWKNDDVKQMIKYAIHKFGVVLLALNITNEWYLCNSKKTSITGKANNQICGGHAILGCGYNRDGVIIHNSWGESWGAYGFALVTWEAFLNQFLYAAVLNNCLNSFKMN